MVAQFNRQYTHFTVKPKFVRSDDGIEVSFAKLRLPNASADGIDRSVKGLVIGIVALSALGGRAQARPPLADPVTLNIGINCQWQQRCIKTQTKAMKRALKYVRQTPLPMWRVQMCNRNAGRQSLRVDWIGFDNCIRNSVLRPIPARVVKPSPRASRAPKTQRSIPRKAARLTESVPATPHTGPGERG